MKLTTLILVGLLVTLSYGRIGKLYESPMKEWKKKVETKTKPDAERVNVPTKETKVKEEPVNATPEGKEEIVAVVVSPSAEQPKPKQV